ncbi:MAG: nuclear transport factor 2 family protein [Acidobacteriia bacterium]|nr:nuclear transport factor 2 family protein [Terriglobia bacterium]
MHPNVAVVEAFLECLRKRDLSGAPFADRILFEDPLTGDPLEGKHNVMRFIQAYLPALAEVRIMTEVSTDNHVACEWEAVTPFGRLTLFQLFEIEHGLIVKLKSYYDPRAILASLGTHGGN